MKAKITRGKSFQAGLGYDLSKGDKAEIIVGAGTTPKELASELEASSSLRSDIAKPVWRASLSASPDDGRLSSEKWQETAEAFMDKMGLGERPYTLIRHSDKDHDHVHLTVSRIGLDGSLWHGKWEAKQAIIVCQRLEKKLGLSLTKGWTPEDRERKKPKTNEIERAARTGEAPARMVLQEIVDRVLEASRGNLQAFCEGFENAGVGLRANLANTGKMNGFSFEYEGVSMKGSDLGKAYTWQGLQRRGLSYEQDRDRETLERYRGGSALDNRRGDQGLQRGDEGLAGGPSQEDRSASFAMGRDEAGVAIADPETGRNEEGRPEPAKDDRDLAKPWEPGQQGGRQSEASLVAASGGADRGGKPGVDAWRAWDELLAKSVAAYRDETVRGQLRHTLEQSQRQREEALRGDLEQTLKRKGPNLER